MFESYETKKIVQAHEVDFINNLRLDSLFILLQDAAASHADLLNLGYKVLTELNFAWVLSWAKLEIAAFPKFGEEISIKTWPKKKYKLFSLRDFFIFNNSGKIINRASTAWLPINMKSKRIIDTSNLPAPIHYLENESAIDDLPGKISESNNKEFILTRKMRYTDIDLNQHVNNIKYIEMIMDSYAKEQYETSLLKSIAVNFVAESKYDDEVEVYRSGGADERSNIIGGFNKNTSRIIFQANLKWEPR